MRDSNLRSLKKTIVWRVLATIITGVVAYLYTGQLGESSKITITAAVALTITYYFHERFWAWLKK